MLPPQPPLPVFAQVLQLTPLTGLTENRSCQPLFGVPFTHAWTSEATENENEPLAPFPSPDANELAV